MESCTNLISLFDRGSFDDFLVDDSSHDGDASFQPSSTETGSRENSPSESLGVEIDSEAASTISSVYSKHVSHILLLVFLIRYRSHTRSTSYARIGLEPVYRQRWEPL